MRLVLPRLPLLVTPALVTGLALSACWGRNVPYEGGTATDDTGVAATTCGEDADLSSGLSITGGTYDFATGGAAAAGLCITAVDPSPAITGGEPTVLASSEVCDDGTYVVAGIQTVPAIGMFLIIDDCAAADSGDTGGADTVMKTAAGISPAQLAGLGAGDQLADITALSVSRDWAATEQADLEAVGWSGDLATSGYMAGFVEDADGAPVSGATVECGGCVPQVYYQDADTADGIYGVAATANLATDAAGGGLFMIPAAPIFSYSAGDGGAHAWENTLLGSLPGYAVYIRFTAAP